MTKILLVEDDKSLREIYGVRLLAEGYDIVSAGDGEEALAMAVKELPNLIISDVMMPRVSGFDMLDILRANPPTRGIKVIMMTALSSEDQRKRGEQRDRPAGPPRDECEQAREQESEGDRRDEMMGVDRMQPAEATSEDVAADRGEDRRHRVDVLEREREAPIGMRSLAVEVQPPGFE